MAAAIAAVRTVLLREFAGMSDVKSLPSEVSSGSPAGGAGRGADFRQLGYVDHPDFHDDSRRSLLLETVAGRLGWDPRHCPGGLREADVSRHDGVGGVSPRVLDADLERSLFLSMNCLRFLASDRESRGGMRCRSESCGLRRRVAACLERSALRVRDRILTSNLALIRALASRLAPDADSRDDLIGVGNLALLRVVDRFDVRYGFRFSTYATTAVRREMIAAMRKRWRDAARVTATPDVDPQTPEAEGGVFDAEQLGMVRQMLHVVPAREREILEARYGLGVGGKVVSYRKLATRFGISPERVRQLVERSFGRIRKQFARKMGIHS